MRNLSVLLLNAEIPTGCISFIISLAEKLIIYGHSDEALISSLMSVCICGSAFAVISGEKDVADLLMTENRSQVKGRSLGFILLGWIKVRKPQEPFHFLGYVQQNC